ncbi:unnamed protein product [Polarella glacialis]|uniref:GST C-terminal domain-containing protein n=1 Tax=Polarella glacialis TaxID=89957 RepID=A0A813HUL9_POLGL|nr:unnamed protein product [Polarella glacialis]
MAEPPPEAHLRPDGSAIKVDGDGQLIRWTRRSDGSWRKPERFPVDSAQLAWITSEIKKAEAESAAKAEAERAKAEAERVEKEEALALEREKAAAIRQQLQLQLPPPWALTLREPPEDAVAQADGSSAEDGSFQVAVKVGIATDIRLDSNCLRMEPPPSVPLVLWWSKTCPYVQRVSIALLEKGLDAQHRQAADIHGGLEDGTFLLRREQVADGQTADGEGEASAPGSIALIGSQVIVEYLDEEFGGAGRRLLPACAAERAQARLFLQAFERALMPCEAELLAARRQDEFVAASGRLDDALKTLEAALTMYSVGLGPFLIGEYFGFVEVLCAPFLQRLVTLLPLLRNISVIERTIGLSRLSSWVAAVVGRPSVVATYDLEAVAEVMLRAVTTLEEKESSAELRARARAFLPYSTLC